MTPTFTTTCGHDVTYDGHAEWHEPDVNYPGGWDADVTITGMVIAGRHFALTRDQLRRHFPHGQLARMEGEIARWLIEDAEDAAIDARDDAADHALRLRQEAGL
jgi:hypothetical protein